MKNIVTGGAGFLGSHLIDLLLKKGEEVICLDNFKTGTQKNIAHLKDNTNFICVDHDVVNPIEINSDKIWHLACPASINEYQKDPIQTSKTIFLGTLNMLELAKKSNARFLLASSSEIYGNPEKHPQKENYWGAVNPIGKRSCYDEGKRIAESLCFDFSRMYGTKIKIARIFNTYGPRLSPRDGRVISNFICQSLQEKSLTIYGNGTQTRSFCFIFDLIDGLDKLMDSQYKGPLNLGNPEEIKINDLAHLINDMVGNNCSFIYNPLPENDPYKRKPDINFARSRLNWYPKVSLYEGLNLTIQYFKKQFQI